MEGIEWQILVGKKEQNQFTLYLDCWNLLNRKNEIVYSVLPDPSAPNGLQTGFGTGWGIKPNLGLKWDLFRE